MVVSSVFRNPRKALHLESNSAAYTLKSAGSALVIGKIVLIMPVAAAKINKTSMVPAFDQTNVQRITQVSSGAANLYAPFLQYKQCFLFLFSIPPEFLKILSTGRL